MVNSARMSYDNAGNLTTATYSAAGVTVATAQNYTADYSGLHFQPSYVNDGVRYMGANGDQYWRDEHGLSTWLRIDFNGAKNR
jgi:hypothetical protein